MERDFREVVQSWLDGNFDEATKAQIRELQAKSIANPGQPDLRSNLSMPVVCPTTGSP